MSKNSIGFLSLKTTEHLNAFTYGSDISVSWNIILTAVGKVVKRNKPQGTEIMEASKRVAAMDTEQSGWM